MPRAPAPAAEPDVPPHPGDPGLMLPSDKAALARADFVSQSTAVEQARAVAEVQAAIVVAQQNPRSMSRVVAAMRESCAQPQLADRAFFRFPRAGTTVSGPSIHLARELARCFGNVQYGINELRRDDVGHYSEMQAWAWDVETNTRTSTTFVVPHKRDKRGGPEVLVDLRDIYESNANQGARRVREQIFAVLPTWLTEEAKALCTATLESGGDKPLATRIADAVKLYEAEFGIVVERLERRIGRAQGLWTAHDVAQLRVAYSSLRQGTVTADEEFPAAAGQGKVTADEITRGAPDDAADEAWRAEAKGED